MIISDISSGYFCESSSSILIFLGCGVRCLLIRRMTCLRVFIGYIFTMTEIFVQFDKCDSVLHSDDVWCLYASILFEVFWCDVPMVVCLYLMFL